MHKERYHYEDLNKIIDNFVDILKELDIYAEPKSNLKQSIEFAKEVLKAYDQNIPLGHDEIQKKECLCAILDYTFWMKRIGGAKAINKYGLKKHVKLLSDALVISPMHEVQNDDHSRKLLELIIALNLLRFVDKLDVDDPESSNSDTPIPDLRFKIKDKWYAIECKTLSSTSSQSIWDRIECASKQINDYKNENYEIEFGIPLVCVKEKSLYEDLENGVYEGIPCVVNQFGWNLKKIFQPLQNQAYANILNQNKHRKTIKGFLCFENLVITTLERNKLRPTNLKVVDFLEIVKDDRMSYARKIIDSLARQIQFMDDGMQIPVKPELRQFNDVINSN